MLYILVGPSGSGKSTTEKALSKIFKINRVLQYTSRPQRAREKNSTDYMFRTLSEFNQLEQSNKFIITQTFNSWKYGVPIRSYWTKQYDNDDYIISISPKGAKILLDNLSKHINIAVIYLKCDMRVLVSRLLDRGDSCQEITRRLTNDMEDFRKANLSYDKSYDTDKLSLYQIIQSFNKTIYNYNKIDIFFKYIKYKIRRI